MAVSLPKGTPENQKPGFLFNTHFILGTPSPLDTATIPDLLNPAPCRTTSRHLTSAPAIRRPYFCSEGDDCYSFVTTCRDSEYETRAYEPSMWVGSPVHPNEDRYRAVDRLRDYFNQKNVPGIQIERTVPLLTLYTSFGRNPTATMVYLMLPRRFYSNPPIPRDTMLFLTPFPPMMVFVKTVGGWLTSLHQKSQEMFEDLLRQAEPFLPNHFYTAEYNGPLTIFNRHNEIWYLSYDVPRCSARFGRGS
ncbi:heme-binding protein 2-like [Stegostoma tigrinum]|uniref:heme-binding protein 2-like n=1 Tax=Stegostoma tigrinum TaxID=3053191 RepID=UPI0028707014|nr:heme-binding protein 2-like [Stegostoma tigrinum]